MIDVFLRTWALEGRAVARVVVNRLGGDEAKDLADAFTAAREQLADKGLRTSTWESTVVRAIPGDRLFEITFRNCESNADRQDDWSIE